MSAWLLSGTEFFFILQESYEHIKKYICVSVNCSCSFCLYALIYPGKSSQINSTSLNIFSCLQKYRASFMGQSNIFNFSKAVFYSKKYSDFVSALGSLPKTNGIVLLMSSFTTYIVLSGIILQVHFDPFPQKLPPFWALI